LREQLAHQQVVERVARLVAVRTRR
jgi:hypothetical protein